MCGLVGMASSSILPADRKVFNHLLYIDQLRGEHSTGIAAVDKKGECFVYKRALAASDFLQLRAYNTTLLKGETVLLGHNRYATMGAKDDSNAHPFQHGSITLAHNGTLDTKYSVMGASDTTRFDTDSETIAYAFSKFEEKGILENLEGAYALTWHDAENNTLNFARNEERPLYLAILGGDLVWASEKGMLHLVAEHTKSTLSDLWMLPVGEWQSYDLNNLKEGGKVTKFTPKKAWYGGTSYGRGNTRGQSRSSKAGTTIEGFLSEVRDSGYFEGYTLDGERVTGNVTKAHAKVWQEAMAQDRMFKGKVTNSYLWYGTGRAQQSHSLSSTGLELLDEVEEGPAEKKCCICQQQINDDEPAELHGGDIYHTTCLDDLDIDRRFRQHRGAI